MQDTLKVKEISKKLFSCFSSKKYSEKICLIDNKLLKVYKDFEMENLEIILDFDLLNCEVKAKPETREFTVFVFNSSLSFTFQCESTARMELWVKEINNHIKMGVGHQLPDLAKRIA